jgi:hypothetical protein
MRKLVHETKMSVAEQHHFNAVPASAPSLIATQKYQKTTKIEAPILLSIVASWKRTNNEPFQIVFLYLYLMNTRIETGAGAAARYGSIFYGSATLQSFLSFWRDDTFDDFTTFVIKTVYYLVVILS